jgi:hypothetical protein
MGKESTKKQGHLKGKKGKRKKIINKSRSTNNNKWNNNK